jgi:hypothetical protein
VQKQINSLYQLNQNIREVLKGASYETPCHLPDGNLLVLLIELPVGFPEVAPRINVSPPSYMHNWITQGGVQCEKLGG